MVVVQWDEDAMVQWGDGTMGHGAGVRRCDVGIFVTNADQRLMPETKSSRQSMSKSRVA